MTARIILLFLSLLLFVALVAFLAPFAHAQQTQMSNFVSGSGSATNTAATTLITQPGGDRRMFITSIAFGRNDAGTTAVKVTLNDDASTVIVLPNSGGGGEVVLTWLTPLTVTGSLTFTSSASTSTVYCTATGYSGN
jgi:hypothetical protein